MKISKLSQQTGASIRSIRYYEKKKLIQPKREENGYRIYDSSDINRIKAIQLFLDLGLTTEEIAPVIACDSLHPIDTNSNCSATALSLYKEKLTKTQKQIQHLQEAEAHLIDIIEFWTKAHQKQVSCEKQ